MKFTFEDYLMKAFTEDGNQDMDMFWDWASNLPFENILVMSQKWHEEEVKQIEKRLSVLELAEKGSK